MGAITCSNLTVKMLYVVIDWLWFGVFIIYVAHVNPVFLMLSFNKYFHVKCQQMRLTTGRNSRPVFCKKGVLKDFVKLTGKHLCQSTLLKKRLWCRCFLEQSLLTSQAKWAKWFRKTLFCLFFHLSPKHINLLLICFCCLL